MASSPGSTSLTSLVRPIIDYQQLYIFDTKSKASSIHFSRFIVSMTADAAVTTTSATNSCTRTGLLYSSSRVFAKNAITHWQSSRLNADVVGLLRLTFVRTLSTLTPLEAVTFKFDDEKSVFIRRLRFIPCIHRMEYCAKCATLISHCVQRQLAQPTQYKCERLTADSECRRCFMRFNSFTIHHILVTRNRRRCILPR